MKKYTSEQYIDREAAVFLSQSQAGEYNDPLHVHDFLEMVYIREGSALQRVAGGEYEVTRGDLLLIREGETHSFEGHCGFSYVNLCIDPRLLLREGDAPSAASLLFGRVAFFDILERNGGCLVRFSERERGEIEELLAVMLREHTARRYGWQKLLRRYLDVFFLSVLRALEERESIGHTEDVWERLAVYINENLTADLSLHTLARRLFYNPSYFSRAFTARFGVGLSAYVAARRAARAADLLRRGGYTVERLAEESGFSSKSALYRAFRTHIGEELGAYMGKGKKTNS